MLSIVQHIQTSLTCLDTVARIVSLCDKSEITPGAAHDPPSLRRLPLPARHLHGDSEAGSGIRL